MRRQLISVVIAGLAVVTGSIGAAPAVRDEAAAVSAQPTVAVQQMVGFRLPEIRDEAAMVLVGTLLIGVAAAVRRAA